VNILSNENTNLVTPDRNAAGSRGDSLAAAQLSTLPRSSVRLSRDTFTTIFSLTENQPWLKEKQLSLAELIDDCTQQEQQLLICELLQRFTFLDGADFQAAIQGIADYIQNDLRLSAADCSISASETGRYADSSHLVVYSLKASKWKSHGWNTTSFVSSLTELVQSAAKGNLIIVDEFIGTGETAEKKVKWLRNQLVARGEDPKIYFAVVAGMEAGIKRVSASVDGIYSAHVLRRGISDAYPAAEVTPNIDAMKAIEATLGSEGQRGKIVKHSLGYKGSESLYSRTNGNTPNNVFPIFWWEVRKDGSLRSTLLTCV
jgi:hypothetical protein